jgi:hypothetical protein
MGAEVDHAVRSVGFVLRDWPSSAFALFGRRDTRCRTNERRRRGRSSLLRSERRPGRPPGAISELRSRRELVLRGIGDRRRRARRPSRQDAAFRSAARRPQRRLRSASCGSPAAIRGIEREKPGSSASSDSLARSTSSAERIRTAGAGVSRSTPESPIVASIPASISSSASKAGRYADGSSLRKAPTSRASAGGGTAAK